MPDDNGFVDCLINGMFPLRLPRWRARFYEERGENPGWEKARLADMHEIVKPGWRIFDIGAEHGDFTALYGTWVGSHVVAVEPSPHYWPIIKAIWEANMPDCSAPEMTFAGFVADEGGFIKMPPGQILYPSGPSYDGIVGFNTPGERLWPVAAYGDGKPEGGFRHLAQDHETPKTEIDALTDKVGAPQGIVMDIEGAEWHALQGAFRYTLDGARPVWWISIHNSESLDADGNIWGGPLKEWYGHEASDIHELMASYDYTATYLGNDGGEEHWRYAPEEGNY